MSGISAAASKDGQAIIIPLPEIHAMRPKTPRITLDNFAENRPPQIVGTIDIADLEKPLKDGQNLLITQVYIKAPGTDFYIPPEYAQFVPALEKIIKHFYNKYSDDEYCFINIVQKTVQPDPSDTRTHIFAHRDSFAGSVNAENQITYIVASSLPTGFATRAYTDDEIRQIKTSADFNAAEQEILNDPKFRYKSAAPAGTIVTFDSTTGHAQENPTIPTERGVLIAAFIGPETKELVCPQTLNNPWLERAVAEQAQPNASASTPPLKAHGYTAGSRCSKQ